jgi:hypothetical protein
MCLRTFSTQSTAADRREYKLPWWIHQAWPERTAC